MVVIFSTFLYEATLDFYFRFLLVVFGVVMLEIGVWGLSSKVLPSERKFINLRTEGDKMIDLIRKLNAIAVAKGEGKESSSEFQATLKQMHASVTRMSNCAGEK